MKIRLSHAMVVTMMMWPLICLFTDPVSAFYSTLGLGVTLLPLAFVKKDEVCFAFALFSCGFVFLTYWTRVPLLLSSGEAYMFPNMGAPTVEEIHHALLLTIAMLVPFMLGVCLPLLRPLKDMNMRRTIPGSSSFLYRAYSGNFLMNLYSGRYVLLGMGLLVLVLRIVVSRLFGVGMMTGDVRQFGFLDRLLPMIPLLFGACTLFVLYITRLKLFFRLLFVGYACMVIAFVILTGSKAGVAYVMLAICMVILLRMGNVRIKPLYLVLGVGSTLIMVFLVFPYAQFLRFAMEKEGVGFGGGFVEAFYMFQENYDTWGALTLFTSRISGLDGMIALNYPESEVLRQYVNTANIMRSVGQSLLPGIHFNELGMGKYIGMIYTGHDLLVHHAGAIGLIPAIELLFGGFMTYPALFISGLIWSGMFRLFWNMYHKTDFKYFIGAIYMYVLARVQLSGNFDAVIILFIQEMLQSILIVYLISKLIHHGLLKREMLYNPNTPRPN